MKLPDTCIKIAIPSDYTDGPKSPVVDPWTGERIAEVVLATEAHAEEATRVAVAAFDVQRRSPSHRRAGLLRFVADRLEGDADRFASLVTAESGKPIALARVEVARAVTTFRLASEEATRIGGEVVPLDVTEATEGYSGHWVRVPRGPVLAISPFNFPLNLVAHKVAPALACGASVVLKPAPQAPLTALALRDLFHDVAPGVCTVLPCDVPIAERLVKDNRFKVLSFTGSAAVGYHLKAIASKKHVVLELGGNAAAIVHEDARDLPWVAARVAASAFGFAGQVCIKTQRLFVHRPIAERFVALLLDEVKRFEVSDPRDPATKLGPMIDEKAARRVEAWVDEACAAGASRLTGGARAGNRHPATVLAIEGLGRGLSVVDEEVFGPVLSVFVYDTWDEAIAMAGRSRYGLQAGVFTDSMSRARAAFDGLDVGGLVVNDTPSVRVDVMPYGGTRDSGLGREGVRYAIEELTERKMLVVRATPPS